MTPEQRGAYLEVAKKHKAEGKDFVIIRPDELISLIAQVEALTVPQWISVEDQLPDVETDVLVRGHRDISLHHEVAGLFHGEWMGQGSEDHLRFIPEHWMELPAAPTIPAIPGTKEGA